MHKTNIKTTKHKHMYTKIEIHIQNLTHRDPQNGTKTYINRDIHAQTRTRSHALPPPVSSSPFRCNPMSCRIR